MTRTRKQGYLCLPADPQDPYSVNDAMIKHRKYFWSYDITARSWRNELSFANGREFSNMPCSRSEFPVATLGGSSGQQAVIFGGYSTCIPRADLSTGLTENYAYLWDTFLYDSHLNVWKAVVSEEWPGYRALSTLVAVPAAETPDPVGEAAASMSSLGISAPTAGGAGSGACRRKLTEGCRLFALGGYGPDMQTFPFTEVWELSLGSSLKHVHAMCWGCGKVEAGLKRCSGTCGGAVATCGSKCLARVWNEGGHKHWCRKMTGGG